MPLPEVFRNARFKLPAKPADRALQTAAVGDTRDIARYQRQEQKKTQWCWAAVACSVAVFYDERTRWHTQCDLANEALQLTDCCHADAPPDCDRWWYLDRVLLLTGNLEAFIEAQKTLDDICAAIDADRVVGVRVQWQGGGGHFLVITGYDRPRRLLVVKDPLFDITLVPFEVLQTAYNGDGQWTHTYQTKPQVVPTKKRRVRSG